MKRICDFATGNAHTIVLIYAIVAVIVWVAVNLYFWKISFDLDREIREEMKMCIRDRFIVARLLNNGEPYTIPTGARAVINLSLIHI